MRVLEPDDRPRAERVVGARPLVSILTPCFRSAAYLARCIESVRAQTYPRVEHIVQDAGSTDGTLDILRRYEGIVDWRSEPDGGQSDGLNRALQRSRGEILGVLNADDEYLPTAVEWAVEGLERHPEAAAIYGQQDNIDADGNVVSRSGGPDPYDLARVICCEAVIPAQAAFLRRSALEAAGFHVDTTRRTCPDYEWWVRLGTRFPIRRVPGLVARYRLHPGSEGQQTSIVRLMVRSKIEVLERLCRAEETPAEIRGLLSRGRAGIHRWAASHFVSPVGGGKEHEALRQVARSFRIRPAAATGFEILGLFAGLLLGAAWGRRRPGATPFVDPRRIREILMRLRILLRKLDAILTGGFVRERLYLPIARARWSRNSDA